MANRASEGTFGSDSRAFEQLLPLCRSGCGIGHRQHTFEAFAVGKNNRVAADRKGHLDLYAAHVNADRSSRCARIGRPSVRFLDLEQFHANPLRAAR
jgi:hypothetical protein